MFDLLLYERTCKKFEAAQMDYKVLKQERQKFTLELSKDGAAITTVIDFEGNNVDSVVDYAIRSFQLLLDWKAKEEKRGK